MISNSRLRCNEKLRAMGYKHLKEIENQNLESNHTTRKKPFVDSFSPSR